MCEMLHIEDVGQLIPLHCHVTRRSVNVEAVVEVVEAVVPNHA
jgi:hypothetical protein